MKQVLILKAESDSSDIYAQLLEENNFQPIFVPTLGFGFKHMDSLREKLQKPKEYAGMVLTSPRSVDAVCTALRDNQLPEKWKELHNYCVGPVTYNYAIAKLDGLETLGKEEGNSNNLAKFITEQFSGDKSLPLLYPCSNLSNETLPIKLLQSDILVDACDVYETIPHPDLGDNLSKALAHENLEYIAFFSPSGVDCCCDYFTKNNINLAGKKLIAIGPSTRKRMESRELQVFRTAEKPSVEYLIKVLLNPDAPVVQKTFENED